MSLLPAAVPDTLPLIVAFQRRIVSSNRYPLLKFSPRRSSNNSLAEKTCTPCRGGTPPLTVEEAEAYRVQAPEWLLRDETTRIERTYRFRNFGDAFAFVRSAGGLAEAEFHHPDISFGWGYATVSLRTKKIRGLHENDFIMAVKLDQLAGEISTADHQASNSGGHRMPDSAY